jgi:hypothetical protein
MNAILSSHWVITMTDPGCLGKLTRFLIRFYPPEKPIPPFEKGKLTVPEEMN